MLTPKLIPIEKMEQEDVQIEKWQPKTKVSTSRNRKSREGYMNIGHHSGRQNLAHGVVEQMEKSEEQQRLDNAAVQLEKMFGLEGMTRPEASIGEALDLYDDVLQKADMNWDNVSEEDLVQLEKLFGIKNPLRREKSTKEKTERAGLEYANGGGKKKAPNLGFSRADQRKKREAAVKAQRAKSRAEVDASIKKPGRFESRVDDLSRGVRRRAGAAKERGGQALRSTKEKGSQAASATKRGARATGRKVRTGIEAIEPAGLQRRRERGGGGPKGRQQAEYKREQSSPTGSEGPPGRSSGSRIADAAKREARGFRAGFSAPFRAAGAAAGATKRAAKDFGRGFAEGAGESLQPFKKPETSAPKQPTQQPAKTSLSDAAKKWSGGGGASGTQKMVMSKAVVSLQKFLDDCGCDSPK